MPDGHKLLEIVEGRRVLTWSLEAALDAALGPVVVVMGCRASEVEALLPREVRSVHNPDWDEGMAGSLRAGVSAVAAPVDAVAIALADMPAVRASHYRTLAAAWAPGLIAVPTHDGRRGHPVVWPAGLLAEFDGLRGDRGAKPLLVRHAEAVVEVPFDDPSVLLDVDDATDLDRARRLLRNRTIPPTEERSA